MWLARLLARVSLLLLLLWRNRLLLWLPRLRARLLSLGKLLRRRIGCRV